MSAIKDAIAAMKEVILLSEKVERAGELLSDVSKELRDHDRRLVRLETLIEVAKASQGRIESK
jgi:thioredoxin-like negative regulator of GroEL